MFLKYTINSIKTILTSFYNNIISNSFNDSDKKRIIMVLDVLRPEFKSNKRKVISIVLTSLFLQKRAEKFKFIYI